MIRALALDDEPPALRVLSHFCSQVPDLDLQKTCTRPDDALAYLREYPVDLLFLDVNMPALSGLEFHRLLPHPTLVVFTTAYAEYAVEGFNLSAVDYLLKPYPFERFQQAIEKTREHLRLRTQAETAQPAYLFVRADYSLYKIALTDIRFVEGLDDYLKIHLDGQRPNAARPVVARMTMKAMAEKLSEVDPTGRFVRVHRSFIVPLDRIDAVRNRMIQLGGEEIPIGASYEAEFFRRFQG